MLPDPNLGDRSAQHLELLLDFTWDRRKHLPHFLGHVAPKEQLPLVWETELLVQVHDLHGVDVDSALAQCIRLDCRVVYALLRLHRRRGLHFDQTPLAIGSRQHIRRDERWSRRAASSSADSDRATTPADSSGRTADT